jgi:hypothetical protein
MLDFPFWQSKWFAGPRMTQGVLNEDFAPKDEFGASFGYEVHQNS